jgi:hypothetical protein
MKKEVPPSFRTVGALAVAGVEDSVSACRGLAQVRHDALDFGDFEQSPACK